MLLQALRAATATSVAARVSPLCSIAGSGTPGIYIDESVLNHHEVLFTVGPPRDYAVVAPELLSESSALCH